MNSDLRKQLESLPGGLARDRPTSRMTADRAVASSIAPAREPSATEAKGVCFPLNSSRGKQEDAAELPLLDEILGRFSDALALVETAHGALENAQEEESPIGACVLTLHRGLEELKGVYTELDLMCTHLRRGEGPA